MKISASGLTAIIAGSAIIGSLALAGTAFAAAPAWQGRGANMPHPAVVGTVASISGDTLTVTARNFQRGTTGATAAPTTATYSVDATNATVTKNGASSSVSAIAVGDMILVQGTVSGTNVAATKINDGFLARAGARPNAMLGRKPNMNAASNTPAITGNGEPVVGGSVTAISGNTITVTTKSNIAYAVDASAATIRKGNAASMISSIATGDNVIVQGTINGTSVTASSVIDQGMPPGTATSTPPAPRKSILNTIGGFFTRLFGFF